MTVIVVEGDGDKALLKYLLDEKLKLNDYEIINNGKHGIKDKHLPRLQKDFDNGYDIILINDQDDLFTKRQNDACKQLKKIYTYLSEVDVCEKIFLLPSNIEGSGKHLEDLLFSCVPEHKKYVLECYETMRECLKTNKDSNTLTIPDHHNQAYVFAGVHLTKKERDLRNDKNTDFHAYGFHRTDIWDYDSTAIQPLLVFLKKHVK